MCSEMLFFRRKNDVQQVDTIHCISGTVFENGIMSFLSSHCSEILKLRKDRIHCHTHTLSSTE